MSSEWNYEICSGAHGYECCGCERHPVGKPWGWNGAAWAEHWDVEHPLAAAVSAVPEEPTKVFDTTQDEG